jgi:hypothetical protein
MVSTENWYRKWLKRSASDTSGRRRGGGGDCRQENKGDRVLRAGVQERGP